MDLRTHVAGADTRIVPAIEQAVGIVPLGIIKLAPGLAVLAGSPRLPGKQTRRPGAVMRLQAQAIIRSAGG